MKNTCPKCQKKLSVFYIKQNCPECGCDLLYYDIENELEKDAEKAEKEFQQLEQILGKIMFVFKKFLVVFKVFKKK